MNSEFVTERALSNYSQSKPWPVYDPWHHNTVKKIDHFLTSWIKKSISPSDIVLIAGCGTKEYHFPAGRIIYMDITEAYATLFEDHIVGNIEAIPLKDESVDAIICVGTVLNYTNAEKTLSEFSRILKPGGHLCMEYERSDSAEFLFTKHYAEDVFESEQEYNNQSHLLLLYSESYIRSLLSRNKLEVLSLQRFHLISALFLRLGMNISKAAKLIYLDILFYPLSRFMACNGIMSIRKKRYQPHRHII